MGMTESVDESWIVSVPARVDVVISRAEYPNLPDLGSEAFEKIVSAAVIAEHGKYPTVDVRMLDFADADICDG